MSQIESNVKQQGLSQLSAEAESFIPSNYMSADDGATGQGSGGGDQEYSLPHYVTSCYPFVVQGDTPNTTSQAPPPANRNQRRGGNNGGWSRSQRNNIPTHQRSPFPQPGGYSMAGPRGPSPNHLLPPGSSHRQPSAPGFTKPGFGMAPPQTMPIPGQAQLPRHHSPGPHASPYYPPPLGIDPGWTGQFPQDMTAQYGLYGQHAAYPQPPHLQGSHWKGKEKWERPEKHGRKKGGGEGYTKGHMVSVGIQNETGPYPGYSSLTKKKNKPRTIICMDAGIQTDFSDDLANLTLAEHPNALYQNEDSKNWSRPWHRYQQETSTDSEEVDSDSGYSSPLHRRNQMSNGTHPAAHGLAQMAHPATQGLAQMAHPGFTDPAILHGGPGFPPPGGYKTNGYMYNHKQPGLESSSISFSPYHKGYTSKPDNRHHVLKSSSSSSSNLVGASPLTVNSKTDPSSGHHPSVQQSNLPPASLGNTISPTEPNNDEEEATSSKKRRGKKRRKKRKGGVEDVGALSDEPFDLQRAHSSSNVSRTSTVDNDLALQFEDEKEFPNLLSSSGSLAAPSSTVMSPMSYSDILKSQRSPRSQESSISGSTSGLRSSRHSLNSTPTSLDHKQLGKESKSARKRRKRREQANAAADEELAEISLEQQVLKELSSKSTSSVSKTGGGDGDEAPPVTQTPAVAAPSGGKKSKQPISLNIADMISALEKQAAQQKAMEKKTSEVGFKRDKDPRVANLLDSTAPVKRGKEREVPKTKKPSPLKKVILKEREEKKRLRLLNETTGAPLSPSPASTDSPMQLHESNMTSSTIPLDSDLSQEGVSSKASSSLDFCTGGTPASAEMSPISQTSPISMSPLSGSPLNSGVNSPVAGNLTLGESALQNENETSVLGKIHSRRFREYCNQVLDKDIDNCCTALLQDLVRFQDRLFNKDPIKAKSKRRIVLGLREVTKHLKLKKIKCVVISPNLERIQSKGGLDDALNTIISLCSDQNVPIVFALGRRALGRACAKLVPVSVVGIFNYEGSEVNFQKLMDLQQEARDQYEKMVELVENEIDKPPYVSISGAGGGTKSGSPNSSGGAAGFQQLFAHMGHSRTPSAGSAISFTSSILSEPISENYPHSEPETDSRGYEIVHEEKTGGLLVKEKSHSSSLPAGGGTEASWRAGDEENDRCDSPHSSSGSQEKMIIMEVLDDIDEGHEADTEEDHQFAKRAVASESGEKTPSSRRWCSELTTSSMGSVSRHSSECEHVQSSDTIEDLPHIDSIHSSAPDLNTEILSQHSSKTYDTSTAEVLSSHSSRTLEGGMVTPDRLSRNMGSMPDLQEACNTQGSVHTERIEPGSPSTILSSQKSRALEKERIETWVAETQKQIEGLNLDEGERSEDADSVVYGESDEEEEADSSVKDTLDTVPNEAS